MTFACRSGEYTLRLGLIGLINPDEAHDGHAVDVQGWTYRNLYPSAALLVARRVNERVEDASDLSEVDRGALDQGEDGTGEEVDAAGIPVKKGFQGLLELGMLVRRASILSDREAPIVSGGVLDGYPRLMSGTMPCTQGSDARAGDRLTAGFISVEKKEGFSLNYSFDRCKVSTRIARL